MAPWSYRLDENRRDACELQPNALKIQLSDQIEQLDELVQTEGDSTAFFFQDIYHRRNAGSD
ncbi:MAG: hypothetical protein R3C05_09315 [Pirellulaceae bacterium]